MKFVTVCPHHKIIINVIETLDGMSCVCVDRMALMSGLFLLNFEQVKLTWFMDVVHCGRCKCEHVMYFYHNISTKRVKILPLSILQVTHVPY